MPLRIITAFSLFEIGMVILGVCLEAQRYYAYIGLRYWRCIHTGCLDRCVNGRGKNGDSSHARYDLVVAISHTGEGEGMERLLILSVMAVLAGCSGKVVTHTSCRENICKGVPFYTMKEVTDRYFYDRILDTDGKAIRVAGKPSGQDCSPMEVEEQKLVVSSTANYIYYDAGVFETSKFGVELNSNGTISKVSTESTPAIKETAEAIAALATAYRTIKPVKTGLVSELPCTSRAP